MHRQHSVASRGICRPQQQERRHCHQVRFGSRTAALLPFFTFFPQRRRLLRFRWSSGVARENQRRRQPHAAAAQRKKRQSASRRLFAFFAFGASCRVAGAKRWPAAPIMILAAHFAFDLFHSLCPPSSSHTLSIFSHPAPRFPAATKSSPTPMQTAQRPCTSPRTAATLPPSVCSSPAPSNTTLLNLLRRLKAAAAARCGWLPLPGTSTPWSRFSRPVLQRRQCMQTPVTANRIWLLHAAAFISRVIRKISASTLQMRFRSVSTAPLFAKQQTFTADSQAAEKNGHAACAALLRQ
jgi:hypothetical protein